MYQKISPYKEVEVVSSLDLINKIIHSESEYLKFNLDEMKDILSSMVIVQLNKKLVEEEKITTRQNLFEISFTDSILFRSIKQYILGMLDDLHSIQLEILNNLTKTNYKRTTFLDNKNLNEFCSEHIINTLSFIRIVDFSNFLLHKISINVLESIPEEKRNQFDKLKIKNSEITEQVMRSFEEMDIDSYTAKLAIKVYHYFLNLNYDELRSFEFGQNVIQNNMQYIMISSNIETVMHKSFDNIIDRGRYNNLDTSKGWTR